MGPKHSGTIGAEAAARYLARELDILGISPLIDEFEDSTPKGKIKFRNVMGILNGKIPYTILIAAHYDTKRGISEFFAGANDSASGVGALLEIARVARTAQKPMPDIIFAFFDGEESMVSYSENDGLHGSKRMAATLVKNQRASKIKAVIILDMVGDKNLNLTIPANVTKELRNHLLEAARIEGLRRYVSLSPTVILDDHVPFIRRNIPAINLIDFEYGSRPGLNDFWHTPEDTLDKLSADSLEKICRLTLRLVGLISNQKSKTSCSDF